MMGCGVGVFSPATFGPVASHAGVATSDAFQRSALGSSDGFAGGLALPWNARNGTWLPNGSVLKPTGSSPGGQGWLVTIDPGLASFAFQVRLATVDGNANGFIFRYVDATNFIRLSHNSTSLAFSRVVAGSLTSIGTGSTGVTPATGDILRGTVNGNAFSAAIWRNGAQVGTAATVASEATHAGATPLGFRGAATSAGWDDLIISGL